MASIKIVTDSTADLSLELIKELGIEMIPLTVNFNNEFFADKIDISPNEFFTRLEKVDELPKTSQPAIGKFKEKYFELASECETIISLHLAGKLSGTYRAARLAADMVEKEADINIEVINSKSVSLGLGFLVLYAVQANNNGLALQEIIEGIKERIEASMVLFTVDTLDYLEKGGRIGKASAFVGSLLNIKPILKVNEEGEVDLHSKARGKRRLFRKLKSQVEKELAVREGSFNPRLGLVHGNALRDVEKLKEELSGLAEWDEIVVSEISPVIGTHVGPGALGVIVV
ncbi:MULTISPECIES: DegV family protein [unclassified Candidatus Frackibacter]|uniref:DegV family protein n=1 Tax=unclassified Candidatus Frackibacter TaxID=2648818 RepID=UPI00088C43B4|nr:MULTISPECIES: DegV family protein [unclassified Candidatus Frackibacter]SDC56843.1 EDD domain protein, DegV family [Candidatus Frackibacter sp. WG11]SEM71074.1 EDD domain protein, DegV family [Candidatus Frackibacter sp. WG12]SFL83278.1 EDD domain protein, DegV family [Candidatus Frackibacter sp. WG13]